MGAAQFALEPILENKEPVKSAPMPLNILQKTTRT
jgi:hypothetical protein